MDLDALLELHQGLPRQAPGSDAATREALRRLCPLPPTPVVADFGCGQGRSTLVLAQSLDVPVIAVDMLAPFLDELRASAKARGLAVDARQGDMADPPGIAPASLDLIWSEGAAYNIGVENALTRWRTLARDGAKAAITEITWLTTAPPPEAAAFWADYPGMADEAENFRRAQRAGWRVLHRFTLPPSAWWDEYYTPLQANIARLKPTATGALADTIAATEREIALYRDHGGSYGYVFYLLEAG